MNRVRIWLNNTDVYIAACEPLFEVSTSRYRFFSFNGLVNLDEDKCMRKRSIWFYSSTRASDQIKDPQSRLNQYDCPIPLLSGGSDPPTKQKRTVTPTDIHYIIWFDKSLFLTPFYFSCCYISLWYFQRQQCLQTITSPFFFKGAVQLSTHSLFQALSKTMAFEIEPLREKPTKCPKTDAPSESNMIHWRLLPAAARTTIGSNSNKSLLCCSPSIIAGSKMPKSVIFQWRLIYIRTPVWALNANSGYRSLQVSSERQAVCYNFGRVGTTYVVQVLKPCLEHL